MPSPFFLAQDVNFTLEIQPRPDRARSGDHPDRGPVKENISLRSLAKKRT